MVHQQKRISEGEGQGITQDFDPLVKKNCIAYMLAIFNTVMRAGALYTAGSLIQKACTAGFIILFTQIMPLEQFGLLMLGVAIMNLVSLLALGGLCSACPKFIPHGKPNGNQYWSCIIVLSLIGLLSIGAICVAVQERVVNTLSLSQAFLPVLGVAILGIPVQGVHRLFQSALQAQERPGALLGLEVFHGMMKIGLPYACYVTSSLAEGAMIGLVVSFGIATLASFALLRTRNIATWPEDEFSIIKNIVGFAAPSMVIGFSYVIAQQLDRLMVGFVGDESQVGLYVVASTLAMTLTIVHTAFTQIYSPVASRISGGNELDCLSQAYEISSRWASAASGAGIILFAAAGPTILNLFGEQYAKESVYYSLLILSFYYFSASLLGPTTQLLQMRGNHIQEGKNAVVFLAANVALNLALIPQIGFVGAALATLLSSMLRSALQAYQIHRHYGLQILNFKRLKILGGVSTATLFIVSLQQNLIVALAVAAFAVIWLSFEIIHQASTYERQMAINFTHKIQSAIRS